jgi:hypothetical protein
MAKEYQNYFRRQNYAIILTKLEFENYKITGFG